MHEEWLVLSQFNRIALSLRSGKSIMWLVVFPFALRLGSKCRYGSCVGGRVKLCDPLVTRGPYLSALEIRSLYIKRYINSPSLLYFTLLRQVHRYASARKRLCNLWTHHLENHLISTTERIWVSLCSDPFSGSGTIEFTRFPWPSLPDLDLWPRDLENLFSNSLSHDYYLWQVSLKSFH